MTDLLHTMMLVGVAVAVVAWLFGVVSHLQMMKTVPLAVARLHMARLRVRSNLLCFAVPELFVGAGATWRRRYLFSMFLFGTAIVAVTLAGMLQRP